MNPAPADNNAGQSLADFGDFGSSEPAGDLFDAAIPPQVAPVNVQNDGDHTPEEL